MKQTLKIAIASALLALGIVANSSAQNLVQSLNVNLIAYDTGRSRTVVIGTQQLIRYLVGTNVPGGRLYLVTRGGNAPGTLDNLNAFLRIKRGSTTIYEVTSPDHFNLYQDTAALRSGGRISLAINRFSIDSGSVRAELQGFSTWAISHRIVNGVDLSGAGSFRSSVNGWIGIFDVTQPIVPVHGVIIAGSPRPGS